MIGHETLDAHEDGRSRAGVTVVLRQVQDEGPKRDLHVEGQPGFETVLPIHCKAEKVEVELLGLGDIEDAQDRDGLQDAQSHGVGRWLYES